MNAESSITVLLERARKGDAGAASELTAALYPELHRMARRQLAREREGHTLEPTALVHEAYLKLVGGAAPEFAGRTHFLAFAARLMRGILVDYARARNSEKRGGGAARVPAGEALELVAGERDFTVRLLDLDSALDELAARYLEAAEAVEMRYFGGLTAAETAEVTGRTIHVVQHDLRLAHAWLRRRIEGRYSGPPQPGQSTSQA